FQIGFLLNLKKLMLWHSCAFLTSFPVRKSYILKDLGGGYLVVLCQNVTSACDLLFPHSLFFSAYRLHSRRSRIRSVKRLINGPCETWTRRRFQLQRMTSHN